MVDLKRISKSTLELKIVAFFHRHPSSLDTAQGIATWLNHDYREVKKALDYLVGQKVLSIIRTGSTTAYAYTQDAKVIEQIEKLINKKN